MVEQRSPKPRAEGSSPSAPAKNSATAFAVALFFVMAVGETEARGACRASPPKRRLWRMQRGGDGAAVGDWQGGPAAADRAGHRKRACEASSSPSLHFRHAMEEFPPFSSLSWVFSPGFIRLQPLLCQRRMVKNLKRRPENDPNAGNIALVIYAGTLSAGQLSAGSSAGGTGWTPAFHRSLSR